MFNFYTHNLKKDKRDDSLWLPVNTNKLDGGISFSGDIFTFRSNSYLDTYDGDFELIFNKCEISITENLVPGMESMNVDVIHPTKGKLGNIRIIMRILLKANTTSPTAPPGYKFLLRVIQG